MLKLCQGPFEFCILLNKLLVFLLFQKPLELVDGAIEHFLHRLFRILNQVIKGGII